MLYVIGRVLRIVLIALAALVVIAVIVVVFFNPFKGTAVANTQPTSTAPRAIAIVNTPVPAVAIVSTPVPANTSVPRLINPADFDATVYVKGALPMYQDLRTHIRTPGDTSSFLINIAVDFPSLTLLRLVADDVLTEATYYSSPTAVGVDLMPLLQMGPVTTDEPADKSLRNYMEARGVNLEVGEILAQNYQAIFLGPVKSGAYFIVRFKDDPSLQVNSGGLISFSADTDPFTVTLQNVLMVNPSFVLP